ncbi:sugar ABC transporter ATP-binding protein [Granulosicoccus antarcticus]|uniref:Galactose/methyl galactoside import ATP-binding protein MglA n=1 Tax=Granulosicoccus antarcticus IMCC3135 TaxID=1192854 RepID=A0A2Z2NGZ3_9GAMM|nr:sugar ABC transporter ATP-binding protein [Granulosicoccus antarcticus]ASJ70552.1 Galactose/methyl galactoside import ATP-binding protein MglA [Granulosicoccus antarcticus IMCC3135]
MNSPSNANPSGHETILDCLGLKKYFGGVKALDGVSFNLRKGEVHALVGENGAGKSTLIKTLSGAFSWDQGTVTLSGKSYSPAHPGEAKDRGLQVVHQEFNLLNYLSVAENICIEAMPRRAFGFLDRKEMMGRARAALDAIGLSDVDVSTKVESLGIAHRQLVEIARALQSKSDILILDEPTATLTDREKERLFEIVASIQVQGVTVVFVSHHLDEVFRICNRVTVFRNGKTVITEDIADSSPERVVQHMIGSSLQADTGNDGKQRILDTVALSVRELVHVQNPHGQGVSFELRYGEILGIAGLVGAGRTEILRSLFGVNKILSGEIQLDGKSIRFRNPNEAIKAGIGFVTEDRKDEGLILDMSIAANVSLVNLKDVSTAGFMRFGDEKAMTENRASQLKLKYGDASHNASSLSGGNQQKVVLAKWLESKPRILLLDEPTRGVDVGAKAEIYSIIKGLASEGMAILVVSSETPELMTLCDRMVVLANHQISGNLDRSEFSEKTILQYAYGQGPNSQQQA